MFFQRAGGASIKSANLRKKLEDREIKWDSMDEAMQALFREAEEKEWQSWLRYKCVEVLSLPESEAVRKKTDPKRILKTDMKLKDKNANARTEENELPVLAKARLCCQGQWEPDAMRGLLKTDAPTVQRTGFFVFLQLVANYGWVDWLRIGDISAAFLQGERREGMEDLFLEQPRRGLPGLQKGQLLRVLKGVYGLPDAPRAWFNAFVGFLTKVLELRQLKLDVAFFVGHDEHGRLNFVLIVHVDDCMLATDGSRIAEAKVAELRRKFPFGAWHEVGKEPNGAVYTGRRVRRGEAGSVEVDMEDFADGRLFEVEAARGERSWEDEATAIEKAEFRSAVGSLHWMSSQYRIDQAFDVNSLQRRQQSTTVGDLKALNKVVRDVRASKEFCLVVRPIRGEMAVLCWHDSSLYGSAGEAIDDDADLAGFDRHKVRSQMGVLVGVAAVEELDVVEEITFSPLDWKSKANPRVTVSTFAAETAAALEGFGMSYFVRALFCEIAEVGDRQVNSYGEDDMKVVMLTDCKSLYDHLKREGTVPEDRYTAVQVAALRGEVSAGAGRNTSKAAMRWLPSRHQLGDGLTKSGLAEQMRTVLTSGRTRLHEMSAQQLLRLRKTRDETHSTADS